MGKMKRCDEASHMAVWGKGILGSRNRRCKGPETGMFATCKEQQQESGERLF